MSSNEYSKILNSINDNKKEIKINEVKLIAFDENSNENDKEILNCEINQEHSVNSNNLRMGEIQDPYTDLKISEQLSNRLKIINN